MSPRAAAVPAGAPPAALVALDRVEKRFGDLLALSGFTLEAREGELVALLGPSGCGKSTVLRLIAGLARPGRGRIAWGPAAAAAGPPGFVFQDPTLMPWATVEANVRLPLRLAGIARRDARPAVAEALASVGLSARADAYPRELSGGMRMRVSIARALVTRPALLLMDEPFAALDEITRFRLNDDLLAIRARRGATIVFVTHSVFEAVFLADRIVVMTPRPGRAFREIAVAAPHPRTAAFRQSPAFAARCREVSAALAAAMEGAGDDL